MGRNVGRLGNGLSCVPDRIYRGVSDWEDWVMEDFKVGDRVRTYGYTGTILCICEDRAWTRFDTHKGELMDRPLFDDDMLSDLERVP